MINRRSMLTRIAGACAASLPASRLLFSQAAQPVSVPDSPTQRIPRYRGFNLQWERPAGNGSKPAFAESDLAMMREWDFNFARIPLSYWIWSKPSAWMSIDEKPFEEIDRLINLGKQYNIHINLNLHRIPGYCINERELEPADLFSGRMQEKERALKAACYHWSWIARRYRGIPSTQLSFDLINEPPRMRSYEGYLEERYFEVASALVAAIRAEDPNRVIFADGINIGQLPVPEFIPLHLVQSTRGYQPKAISHYRATWVPLDEYETMKPPTWPLTDDKGTVWDRARLAKEYLDPWRSLIAQGVQIHVGEWGCYNQTPHDIALAWMSDCLSTWREVGWGNALWNLRGSFGILDSERKDVAYENFKGHKLDRKMLELLRSA
ncbi:MAG TPA: cellulase family glycosylhydrolase [Terracidiphilus sp.]|nr:cellulase family glycosylhydrolase [Terracidiphilus sp.]